MHSEDTPGFGFVACVFNGIVYYSIAKIPTIWSNGIIFLWLIVIWSIGFYTELQGVAKMPPGFIAYVFHGLV